MRVRSLLPGLMLTLLAGLFALAGSGVVLDQDGKPLTVEVKVCHFDVATKVEVLCVNTDDHGAFEILESDIDTIQISAPGFFPEQRSNAGFQTVTLRHSPALMVRVLDGATGKPLEQSEVWVVYPSAKKKGPFPSRGKGVRILRILDAGDVRVFGTADGYEDSAPVDVKLEPGKESQVVLELRRAKPDGG